MGQTQSAGTPLAASPQVGKKLLTSTASVWFVSLPRILLKVAPSTIVSKLCSVLTKLNTVSFAGKGGGKAGVELSSSAFSPSLFSFHHLVHSEGLSLSCSFCCPECNYKTTFCFSFTSVCVPQISFLAFISRPLLAQTVSIKLLFLDLLESALSERGKGLLDLVYTRL